MQKHLLIGLVIIAFMFFFQTQTKAQKSFSFRLPDSGQSTSFTTTHGEDGDYTLNPPSLTDNGNGTITDNNTGLMWQKIDGGEMTFENATAYCNNLELGGFTDWRLPTGLELFSINNYDRINPALNSTLFTSTQAEYWWTCEVQNDASTHVWVVNAGGGIGAHPKMETLSAGGSRRFHARAVRNAVSTTISLPRFTDNDNETITDNLTGLTWQKIKPAETFTWEEALAYAGSLSLAGKTDWRIPNIRELQSLNDPALSKPSFNKTYFPNCIAGNYWSSTSMLNAATKAWGINIDYGIVSYNDKTAKENILLVRGGTDNTDLNFTEAHIPGGEFEMGDHFGFVDPSHPSDELPLHMVKVNALYMSKTETTNQQFMAFLNDALLKGLIEVRSNVVYVKGGNDIYYYTNQYASYYSIGYDGKVFSMTDFRANHPVNGVMWFGAAAFCNWLSRQNGLGECYNLNTWACDFTQNGYRLPTEAEWEYAGRGGQTNPYFNYPWGNDQDVTKANWPDSKDPYEGTSAAAYPFTTPVGFYDGSLRLKMDFNWPGNVSSYQTSNGANGFGLYDMAGNVWELINDWYGQNYYSTSPYDNPTGPTSGFIMPDGKAYRGMRGGNWYNGYSTTSINDGHSRVSNRNPSYYRGPQDPNHPWYHIGFRTARKYTETPTGMEDEPGNPGISFETYPNPCQQTATFSITLPVGGKAKMCIYNALGKQVAIPVDEALPAGIHHFEWNVAGQSPGIYFCSLQTGISVISKSIIISK